MPSLQATIKLADQYKNLHARLQLATKATGDYAMVSDQLFKISQKTGTQFGANVSLFQGIARIAPEIGATSDQVLQLTTAVGQLGTLSGAGADQMGNAMLQFQQGLAGGVFRAEEFNSILENLPELANRMAKGFGVTQGGLRQMVLDGKLLSKDVFNVLVDQAGEIEAEFQTMPQTVGRSTTAIGNCLE